MLSAGRPTLAVSINKTNVDTETIVVVGRVVSLTSAACSKRHISGENWLLKINI